MNHPVATIPQRSMAGGQFRRFPDSVRRKRSTSSRLVFVLGARRALNQSPGARSAYCARCHLTPVSAVTVILYNNISNSPSSSRASRRRGGRERIVREVVIPSRRPRAFRDESFATVLNLSTFLFDLRDRRFSLAGRKTPSTPATNSPTTLRGKFRLACTRTDGSILSTMSSFVARCG